MQSITFRYEKIPPSVNKLYTLRHGRKILTTAARKYKNAFIACHGGAELMDFVQFEASPNDPYELHLWFYLRRERVLNVTYGIDGRVKSPYRDIDVSNLVKLLEDCIATLVNIRDRNNFTVCAHKREALGPEYVIAVLRPIELSSDPYTPEGLLNG